MRRSTWTDLLCSGRHYDVIASGATSGWDTEPFSLTGLNGYLYGRGVSDNKGPTLAVACAASEMLARRALDVDLVMLIEGEEEAGSVGFAEAVRRHKVRFPPALVSYRRAQSDYVRRLTFFSRIKSGL